MTERWATVYRGEMSRIISVRIRRTPATRRRYCHGFVLRVGSVTWYWAIWGGMADASGGLASTWRETTEKPDALSSRILSQDTGTGPVTNQAVWVRPATARRSTSSVPSPTMARPLPLMIASTTAVPVRVWLVRSRPTVSDRLSVSPTDTPSARATSSEMTA